MDDAVVAEGVDAGGADERAEFYFALRLAYGVIDRDMTFGINLVRVDAEFGFDIDGHKTSNRMDSPARLSDCGFTFWSLRHCRNQCAENVIDDFWLV